MSRVDDALKELAGKLSREELARVAERIEEVEVEPDGSWVLTVDNKTVAPGRIDKVAIGHREKSGPDDVEWNVDLTVTFYHGHDDGRPVIQIDGSGPFRVNVNDGPIWDGEPGHQHEHCRCVEGSSE